MLERKMQRCSNAGINSHEIRRVRATSYFGSSDNRAADFSFIPTCPQPYNNNNQIRHLVPEIIAYIGIVGKLTESSPSTEAIEIKHSSGTKKDTNDLQFSKDNLIFFPLHSIRRDINVLLLAMMEPRSNDIHQPRHSQLFKFRKRLIHCHNRKREARNAGCYD